MTPFLRLIAPAACALAAIPAPGQAFEDAVQEALQRAREPLLEQLAAAARQGEPGVLGLLCLAALHDGVPADDPVLGPALRRLAAAEADQTYALALRLMVAEACPTFADRERIARADAKELLLHRFGGAFGYTRSAGRWDLSNTQYAALGLRAAAGLGVAIDRRVWSRLADEIAGAQHSNGSFGYQTGAPSSASMTAAGIAVLSICHQQLAAGRGSSSGDGCLKKAWRWLDEHAAAIGDFAGPWSLYFHYGLERAAILCDVAKVGGRDWFRAGGEMLLREQRPGGGWTSARAPGAVAPARGTPIDTAFAVLFLQRKFRKAIATPTTPGAASLATLGEQSTPAEVRSCAQALERRGMAAMTEILLALRGPVAPRRRAAALALRAIAGQDFGIDPELDADRNTGPLRQAELWYLRHR